MSKGKSGGKNFRKMVFPKDWVGYRPYNKVGEADVYYASVASEVYSLIRSSFLFEDVFKSEDDTKRASIMLTSLFEDIISGIGVWNLAIGEFHRRYGKILPFYDTSDYVRGEINLQDVQLLLWDIVQSFKDRSIINPENPYILSLASDIFSIFDSEYEYAVENVPLKEFLTSPSSGWPYWEVRPRLEWILDGCFLFHRFLTELPSMIEHGLRTEGAEDIPADEIIYSIRVNSLYDFRGNLLSMNCPGILSRICGNDPEGRIADMRKVPILDYLYLGKDSSALSTRRLCDGELFRIELDSFNGLDTSAMVEGKTALSCSIVSFGEKWYQSGYMLEIPSIAYSEEMRRKEEMRLDPFLSEKTASGIISRFDGRWWHIFPSFEEVKAFYNEALGVNPSFRSLDLEENARPYLVGLSHAGLSISSGNVSPSIFSPDNPYYDKDAAKKKAIDLVVNPGGCSYETACALRDGGCLPDAMLNSSKGEEHGRALVKDNAEFLTDYFFRRYRGDDLWERGAARWKRLC